MNVQRMDMLVFCRDVVSASLPDISTRLSRVLERKIGELKLAEERAIAQMSPYSDKSATRENYHRALDCLAHLDESMSCIMEEDWDGLYSNLDKVTEL